MSSDSRGEASQLPESASIEDLSDTGLARAVDDQRTALEQSERDFVRARDIVDRSRRRLRALESEQERRLLAQQGIERPAPIEKARRRRSTTGMDALLGRDNIDPDKPLSAFRFLSLQRQPVLLARESNPDRQALRFVDPTHGAEVAAYTFGEARRLHEAGYRQGRPHDPLERHDIWYVAEAKSGRVRLDQLFVEQDVEEP